MRRLAIFLPLLLALAFAADDGKPPDWAYPVNPPDFKLAPDDGTPRRVPDSSASYTLTQIRDLFFAPDWHPQDHPALPERAPQRLMIAIAKDISDEEAEAAAAYFSALKPRSAIQVIESETVPKTYVAGWFLAIKAGSESEPLGQR